MGHEVRQRVRFGSSIALTGYCVAALLGWNGCASDAGHDHDHDHDEHGGMIGEPSGAICPPDSSGLTYEAFGKQFMTTYCTRCHSDQLVTQAERMGATAGHDFNVEAGIRTVWEHIDQYAAAGPNKVNDKMPPATDGGPKPTLEERQKLGQWLACQYGDAQ